MTLPDILQKYFRKHNTNKIRTKNSRRLDLWFKMNGLPFPLHLTEQNPFVLQPGPWTYTLNNTHHSLQSLKVTVTSRASHPAEPPATVEAFVEKDSASFPLPVMIYANVRRGLYPILNATVTATIEPEAGEPVTLKLFDDGAGNKPCHVLFHVLESCCDAVVSLSSSSLIFFQFSHFAHPTL